MASDPIPTLADLRGDLRRAREDRALARLFGVGELPEVVVLPLPLLEEIGRRVRPTKPLDDEEETKATGP